MNQKYIKPADNKMKNYRTALITGSLSIGRPIPDLRAGTITIFVVIVV
jgi:hypothetical protein